MAEKRRLHARLALLAFTAALVFTAAALCVARLRASQEPVTVLAVGTDASGCNTDVLLLARLDRAAGTLDVVSLPRDTMVNVSWEVKKLNSVCARAGMDGLLDAVEGLAGFRPQHWVKVELAAFEAVVDELGGLRFDVPADMDYDDAAQGLSIHLKAGEQTLTGAQALGVFRFRQNADGTGYLRGDLDRIGTQQALLSALAEKLLSGRTVFHLGGLLRIARENTGMSLSAAELLRCGLQAAGAELRFHTMPVRDAAQGRLSYVCPEPAAWLALLNGHFGPVTDAALRFPCMGTDGALRMTDGSALYTNFY